MLKKQFRLPATVRLSRCVFITTPFFTIRVAQNGLAYNRYGFVVPKQVDKRAVIRNRLKRRVRGCVERLFDKIMSGNDFLFFLKKEATEQSTQSLYGLLSERLVEKKLLTP